MSALKESAGKSGSRFGTVSLAGFVGSIICLFLVARSVIPGASIVALGLAIVSSVGVASYLIWLLLRAWLPVVLAVTGLSLSLTFMIGLLGFLTDVPNWVQAVGALSIFVVVIAYWITGLTVGGTESAGKVFWQIPGPAQMELFPACVMVLFFLAHCFSQVSGVEIALLWSFVIGSSLCVFYPFVLAIETVDCCGDEKTEFINRIERALLKLRGYCESWLKVDRLKFLVLLSAGFIVVYGLVGRGLIVSEFVGWGLTIICLSCLSALLLPHAARAIFVLLLCGIACRAVLVALDFVIFAREPAEAPFLWANFLALSLVFAMVLYGKLMASLKAGRTLRGAVWDQIPFMFVFVLAGSLLICLALLPARIIAGPSSDFHLGVALLSFEAAFLVSGIVVLAAVGWLEKYRPRKETIRWTPR